MADPQSSERFKTWDEWMPRIQLSIPVETYLRLPRNPAYNYEYCGQEAILTPRPRHFHGVLPLKQFRMPAPKIGTQVIIRPMERHDSEEYSTVFASAFQDVQPFGSLLDDERREAARQTIIKTLDGQDGPLIEAACFTASYIEDGRAIGAILITQVSGGDPSDSTSYIGHEMTLKWEVGQPHLTWIFVAPAYKSMGVGSALLAAAVETLVKIGHQELWTTFLLGNESSMLWHWRHGFRLATRPGS
jgi:GNAT superfamily N-acetyltransferase